MISGATTAKSSRIEPLTSIRFFAAFAVVVYHSEPIFLNGMYPLLRGMASLGFLGVSFFFVLSGYVLAFTYVPLDRFDSATFWRARIARILPLYLLALLIQSPLIAMHRLHADGLGKGTLKFIASLLPNIFMLQAWYPDFRAGWNNPGWSLSVEAFFYLLFPLMILGLSVNIREYPLAWFCASAAAATLVPSIIVMKFGSKIPDQVLEWAKFSPLLHLPEFVAGVALFLWQRCGYLDGVKMLSRSPMSSAIVSTSILALVSTAAFVGPQYLLLHNGLLIAPFAACIAWLAQPQGQMKRFLAARWLVLLGEASYAVYLLHVPLLQWLVRAFHQGNWSLSSVQLVPAARGFLAFCAYSMLLLLTSLVCFSKVEVPLRAKIRRG